MAFQSLPTPALITIQGNISYPQNVVLVCSPPCNGYFLTFQFLSSLQFYGFTLSNGNPSSTSSYGILIGGNTFLNTASLRISNFYIGAEIVSSLALLPEVVITGAGSAGVLINNFGNADVYGASISGTNVANSIGVNVVSGYAYAATSHISGFQYGFLCNGGLGGVVETDSGLYGPPTFGSTPTSSNEYSCTNRN